MKIVTRNILKIMNKSLHPALNKLYTKFPKNIENFRNLIFYGPPGVGKYTKCP